MIAVSGALLCSSEQTQSSCMEPIYNGLHWKSAVFFPLWGWQVNLSNVEVWCFVLEPESMFKAGVARIFRSWSFTIRLMIDLCFCVCASGHVLACNWANLPFPACLLLWMETEWTESAYIYFHTTNTHASVLLICCSVFRCLYGWHYTPCVSVTEGKKVSHDS